MIALSVLKAIHIIFVVSYFAGLFYMVRLFIYQTDAHQMEVSKSSVLIPQFRFMQERLWNIIIVPSSIIMLLSGLGMLYLDSDLLKLPWMHIKLTLLVLFFAYHIWTWRTLIQLKKDRYVLTSVQLRMMNEVATLFLFAIVFVVILKGYFLRYWYWALISFVILGLIIMLMVKITNRKKK